jgi:Rrf2 family transcriptional regulator, nitric oxide-sensitive transcriptional repressor
MIGISDLRRDKADYSPRLAIYLACHPDRAVSVDEISRAFGISRHPVVKVVQTLTDLSVVGAQRGRGGGMRLDIRPSEINVGSRLGTGRIAH